jgi:hypothetical protein
VDASAPAGVSCRCAAIRTRRRLQGDAQPLGQFPERLRRSAKLVVLDTKASQFLFGAPQPLL